MCRHFYGFFLYPPASSYKALRGVGIQLQSIILKSLKINFDKMRFLRAIISILIMGVIPFSCYSKNENFIDSLMAKMTLQEKIGQLNLPAGGDVVSGQVFETDIADLISTGRAGGFFNVKGVEKISDFQRLAVEKSRLGIPLLVGADVIHGYETMFPIPIALSCSWNPEAVERMARISPKFKLLQTPLARVMLPHVKIADISARSGMEVSTLIAAIKEQIEGIIAGKP